MTKGCDFCQAHAKKFNISVDDIFCPRCYAAEQDRIKLEQHKQKVDKPSKT